MMKILAHPLTIRPLCRHLGLDFVVVQELPPGRVDGDHLTGPDPSRLHDLAQRQIGEPDFRTHDDQAVGRNLIPGGA